jgi:hypothetical protein
MRARTTAGHLISLTLVSVVLAACSSGSAQVAEPSAQIVPDGRTGKAAAAANASPSLLPQIGPKVAARKADSAYQMTPDELKLDCKKLTGKMQVRILQIRDEREKTLTSKTSQVMQRAVVPVLGGSPYGARPDDDFRRDRSWLEAYNAQLATKKCPTYDLDNELQPRSIRDTPKPVPNPDAPPAKTKP